MTATMPIPFSEQQSRTIAGAITTVSALVIVFAIALVGWLLAAFLNYFSGVFLPIVVGAIAALVCRPYYEWLGARLKMPPAVAVVAVFLSMLIPLVGFGWFFGRILLTQLGGLVENAPEYIESIRGWLSARTPRLVEIAQEWGIDERFRQTVSGQQETIAQGLQQLGSQAFSAGMGVVRRVSALFGWLVLPVYFAYFLTVGGVRLDSAKLLPFLKPETRKDAEYLLKEFVDIIVAFFRGQLIVAMLQGVLYAIGFSIIGLRYGFVVGMLLGLLNIVPYLGSMIGLAITIPMSLFQEGGGTTLCVLALAVIVIVQQIESWFLTPKIMGDRTGLHFMAIIVAIFFWGTAIGGILGMILAIPLTAFLASFWRLAREKYIPEIL